MTHLTRAFAKTTAALLLLGSCATSTEQYIDGARGYAVTRGEVVRIDNLSALGRKNLSDGVALEIDQGGRVTMRFGDRNQTFDLAPGSRLVLGQDVDAILQSNGAPTERPSEQRLEPGSQK